MFSSIITLAVGRGDGRQLPPGAEDPKIRGSKEKFGR